MEQEKTMLLSDVKNTGKVKITSIRDNGLQMTLIKMGLGEGDIVEIRQKLSAGPILICKDSQEIALGYEHLKHIEVAESNGTRS